MDGTYPKTSQSASGFHESGLTFRNRIQELARLIWPAHCLVCETQLSDLPGVCPACWESFDWCTGSICYGCASPVEAGPLDEPPEHRWCSSCAETPPIWRRAAAGFRYDGIGKQLVLSLKTSPRAELLSAAGRWMAGAAAWALSEDPIIIPVPLHSSRLRARGFNQAALLARAMARYSKGEVRTDILRRTRATRRLAEIPHADERAKAIAGSISLAPSKDAVIKGRNVLLVDDVLTSGATLGACSSALRLSGADCIDIVVLARHFGSGDGQGY